MEYKHKLASMHLTTLQDGLEVAKPQRDMLTGYQTPATFIIIIIQ